MISTRAIIAQKRWRLVHVHDHDIDVAIVIEIAEGAPAAGVRSGNGWSGFVEQFFETSAAQIAEHDARILVGEKRRLFFQLRKNLTSGDENIRQAVVVEIHDSRAPADE